MNPQSRDSDELEDRLRELHDASFGWACSCCGWNETEAEDVLQEAYLKVISGRASFDGRSAFRTWLFGVIRFTALERSRKARSRWARWDRLAAETAAEGRVEQPPDLEEGDERARLLRQGLETLPERQRQIVHLVFYEEMTIREAAEVMGVSIGSARVHYDRAKKKLRSFLADQAVRGGS